MAPHEASRQRPSVAVLGAGANGSGIAADMIRAGHDVTLFEQWPANVEAVRAHGLRVTTEHGTTTTPADVHHLHEVASTRRRFDVVLVVLKAYDTGWGAQLMAPLLADDGLMAGLQNGMEVDAIAAAVGARRTVAGVIEISAAMDEPGVVDRHSPPERSWFAVGPADASGPSDVQRVADLLSTSGTVEVREDVMAAKWMKLALNAAELVPSAILDLPIVEAARVPGMEGFMRRAAVEALVSSGALGHATTSIFGLDVTGVRSPEAFADLLWGKLMSSYVLPHTRSTVLQDWSKGRRSEVQQINGLVVAEHRSRGAEAPANAAAAALAADVEAGRLDRGPANLEDLLALEASLRAAGGR